jgi:hypothetical protein
MFLTGNHISRWNTGMFRKIKVAFSKEEPEVRHVNVIVLKETRPPKFAAVSVLRALRPKSV